MFIGRHGLGNSSDEIPPSLGTLACVQLEIETTQYNSKHTRLVLSALVLEGHFT